MAPFKMGSEVAGEKALTIEPITSESVAASTFTGAGFVSGSKVSDPASSKPSLLRPFPACSIVHPIPSTIGELGVAGVIKGGATSVRRSASRSSVATC